jgi:segregation and condensation protein B
VTDDRRDSLAEQAAAWVPPWQREEPGAVRPQDAPPPVPAPESSPAAEAPGEGADAVPDAGAVVAAAAAEPVVAEAVTAEPVTAELPAESAVAAVAVAPAAGAPVTAEPAAVDPSVEPADARGPLALIDDRELRAALEAILLVVDEPVSEVVLAQVLEQPTERVAAMLERLAHDYTAAGHGFDLRRAAGGWRLYTRPEYAPYVERFVLDGQSARLTQAALETLAVIAYKQPVTRSRISAIRGVNCDGVVRTLLSRGLIEECGTEPQTGAHLYRTTNLFLEKLGLDSLDQLPPLAPFLPENLEEIPDAPR